MSCCQSEKTTNYSQNQTTSPEAWVTGAGKQNYDFAKSFAQQPFQPYTAPRVADLSPDELSAFASLRSAAGSPNPYSGTAAALTKNYANAPGQQYDFIRAIDDLPGAGGGKSGSISDYMNPYLEGVLGPQLREIALKGSLDRQGINANATSAGAYGDARHGVVESLQRKNENQLASDTTGKAWSDAFNNAMGLKVGDINRLFSTQQAQGQANETALGRQLGGAQELTNLDKYDVSRLLGLTGAEANAGATARGIEQSKLDTGYQEFIRQLQDPYQKAQFLSTLLRTTPYATTSTGSGTSTTTQPNTGLYNLLGTLGGTLLDFAMPGAGTATKAGMSIASGGGHDSG